MASEDIAYEYEEGKNPDGTWIDGVPRRDLTKGEFEKLPPYLRAAVKREPYYVPVDKAVKAGKTADPAPGNKED